MFRQATALQRLLLPAGVVLPLALAMALLVAWTGLAQGSERTLHGLRDTLRTQSASGRFVVVDIDARSLRAINRWPWPRHIYGEAIARLEQAGADTVAFDIDFSSPSVPREDRAFASAIAAASTPVILPTFLQRASFKSGNIVENVPIALLRAHAQLAAVNITGDSDGMVRHYPYGVNVDGLPRPSFAAILAGSSGEAASVFPIDGAIDPSTIPRYSFIDVLEGRIPKGALQGKSVLVGGTAIELGDRYSIPRYGIIPGPVIQLLAAETLANGSAPFDHGWLVPILAALLVLMAAMRFRKSASATVLGGGFAAILGLPLATELLHLGTFEIAPGLMALLTGSSVLTGTAFIRELNAARRFDPATGLPNRRGFEHATARKSVASVTVLRISNYSEAAGITGQGRAGEMMQRVVDRLKVAGLPELYRLEDGVLAWTGTTTLTDADVHAIEGLSAIMRSPVEVGGRQLELRCQFGFASDPEVDSSLLADRAILAADHAAKKGSKFEVHSFELSDEEDWTLTLASEVEQALASGDVSVVYQPKYDIARKEVTSAEALVRWHHPVRGSMPPDTFIPALEESGHILDLTLFVLRQAAKDAAAWQAAGKQINVAVNVSAILTIDEEFLDALDHLLQTGELTADMLTLEVTETATLADPDRAFAALMRIKMWGVKLAIDDYGTGQSTLSYLKGLPAREIKIDKSFILGLRSSRSDQIMVSSTIQLAHELGYTVVAEGVETAEILEMLMGMGCDVAQGWHLGKPAPAEEFAASYVECSEAA